MGLAAPKKRPEARRPFQGLPGLMPVRSVSKRVHMIMRVRP